MDERLRKALLDAAWSQADLMRSRVNGYGGSRYGVSLADVEKAIKKWREAAPLVERG